MAFKKGHDPRRGKGGKRPGAGRKSKIRKEREQATEKRLRDGLFNKAWPIFDEYVRVAKGGKLRAGQSAATLRHAIDKLLPPVEKIQHSGSVIYNTNLDIPKK